MGILKVGSGMEKEFLFTLMVISTVDGGKMDKNTEKGVWCLSRTRCK